MTRDYVISVLNAAGIPLHREEIVRRVREDFGLACNSGTVYKWLSILTKQGRLQKERPGVYASNAAAKNYREEENDG